ncbi:LacI family transcriptional regulator [Paenibacillus pectinilyticus]|uniref:LacI family transcriptional regulator n=1 Tax=Paenibacillus pectinilyticus TaxID=512399 RepID=A0A1C1A5M9_9BACL|nr:LacI family DNA-binding transcriptional regulator [Paenibacillus pectinilyticus]OCT15866.1 LacI family transcriptional regulator [Paenibacillus pectinilyticus]
MANIDDVAKIAGVSKSTVSNVFSKKRPISKEVSQRVLDAALDLNYRPNYWARSLANKRTNIIGLNMPGEQVKFSQFHLGLFNGVLKECYSQGYRLLVNTLSTEFSKQVEYVATDPVDGDILLDPAENDERISERIMRKLPLVVIGRPHHEYESSVSYVDNDNVGMGQIVAEHLLQLGHSHILFLNTQKERTVAQDREQGFIKAFQKADMPIDPKLIVYKDGKLTSTTYGYQMTKRLLASHPQITAIITDTDKVALGVYQAAEELKLRIPDDLSVFAFSDDSIYAPEFKPPLTGVRLNGEVLGSEAAKLLIEQLRVPNTIVKRILIPASLVFRGSCAKARTENNK